MTRCPLVNSGLKSVFYTASALAEVGQNTPRTCEAERAKPAPKTARDLPDSKKSGCEEIRMNVTFLMTIEKIISLIRSTEPIRKNAKENERSDA